MWILILLDHRVCHVNPFHRCVSPQVDPILSTFTRSIISSSQWCLFHPSPSCLCFSRPPTLFLQGLRFLIQVSFYYCEVSPFLFPSMFLPGVSHEDPNGASSSSFFVSFIFSGGFKSSFGDLTLSSFQCLLIPVHLIIIHFSLFICSGVLKISQKIQVFILIPSKLFRGCYLAQDVQINRCITSF